MDTSTYYHPIFSSITSFFDHPFFIIVGGLATILMILGFVSTLFFIIKGIVPVWYRLGLGLTKRRIAVFADIRAFTGLKEALVESKIFKAENVLHIIDSNIDKAKDKSVFLVDWDSFSQHIETVFNARKNDQTPIIIFAKPATIPNDKMSDIGNRANTIVVNFRGRLLNDILTSLITTSYER